MDCEYTFPIDLALNDNPFGAIFAWCLICVSFCLSLHTLMLTAANFKIEILELVESVSVCLLKIVESLLFDQ